MTGSRSTVLATRRQPWWKKEQQGEEEKVKKEKVKKEKVKKEKKVRKLDQSTDK